MFLQFILGVLNIASTMYNASLLKTAMEQRGLNFYRLGKAAGVDPKTAKKLVLTGEGHPDKAYAVAVALGIKVKRDNLSPILARVA